MTVGQDVGRKKKKNEKWLKNDDRSVTINAGFNKNGG